jgi:hypothetical protein
MEEEKLSVEEVAAKGLVDVMDAWDNAMADWLDDTEEIEKNYNIRCAPAMNAPPQSPPPHLGRRAYPLAFSLPVHSTLHFDAFRDSVFELIDLCTAPPRQNPALPVAAAKSLGLTPPWCSACAADTPTTDDKQYVGYLRKLIRQIAVVDGHGAPTSWRHPWPKVPSAAKELHAQLRAALASEGEDALRARFEQWYTAQQVRTCRIEAHTTLPCVCVYVSVCVRSPPACSSPLCSSVVTRRDPTRC